jgi:hypothetical protein
VNHDRAALQAIGRSATHSSFSGGGLRTGQVAGATDARRGWPKGQPYTPQSVLATLYHVLGIHPGTTWPDPTGRPIYLLDDRRMIEELMGGLPRDGATHAFREPPREFLALFA